MTVLAVLPGKAPERMELDGSLESMQEFVGGTIQALYPFSDPVAIVCNDDGKLIGLEHNRALRDDDGNVYDILCGPFFICGWVRKTSHPCRRICSGSMPSASSIRNFS